MLVCGLGDCGFEVFGGLVGRRVFRIIVGFVDIVLLCWVNGLFFMFVF